MSYCDFTSEELGGGKYRATCVRCGRVVVTRTRFITAACKASGDYKSTHERMAAATTGAAAEGRGAGTELKAMLRDWLGFVADSNCGCNEMARRMDMFGADWCEGPGMPQILGVMRAEHAKRRAAGQTILPWSDFAAKQLVLLACRRARAALDNR